MSFFPRAFYESDASSFTPLFRLLDDFDTYSRQGQGGTSSTRRGGSSIWQPKFDVRETSDAYELHGELPGMNKDTVQIEFTEPQSMVVRGKAERTYTAGTPPSTSGQIEDVSDKPAAIEGQQEVQKKDDAQAVQKQDEQPKYKYWLTERSVGEFSRTFNFPTPVEHDNVSAGFKDGILSVSVPKAKKPESRRITIN